MANIPNMDVLQLSETISKAAREIHDFLGKNGASLSFDPSAAKFPDLEEVEFHKARKTIFGAASTLLNLVVDPMDFVFLRGSEVATSSALRIACKYKFAQAVPTGGSATCAQIAEKVGLDTAAVERIITVLMGAHIFRPVLSRPTDSDTGLEVEHTRLSHLLATDEGFDATMHLFTEHHGAVAHIADAIDRWGYNSETTNTAFNIFQKTDLSYWGSINSDPALRERCLNAFRFLATCETPDVHGPDWAGMGDAVVVDVGGGKGPVSIRIAQKAPSIQCIVQDYENTCKDGEAGLPSEFRGRVTFQPHDIFQPQDKIPDKKVLYVLRSVLHNWSDKYARRILQAIIPALKPGDRIIISEALLPDPDSGDVLRERVRSSADAMMWALCNGRERTVRDFRILAQSAHPDLKVVDSFTPEVGWFYTIVMALGEDGA